MSDQILPLTRLSEDEIMFKDMVYKFAEEQVKPYITEMDREGSFKPEIIKQFFELGLMPNQAPI